MSTIQTIFDKLDSNFSSQCINNIDNGEDQIVFKCGENSFIKYIPTDDNVKLSFYCELNKYNTEQEIFEKYNGILPIFDYTINNDNVTHYIDLIDRIINLLNENKKENIDLMFDIITKIVRISNIGDAYCSSKISDIFTAKNHEESFYIKFNINDNAEDADIECVVNLPLAEQHEEKSIKSINIIIPRFSKDGETILIKGEEAQAINMIISPMTKLDDLLGLIYDTNDMVDEELKSQSIWSKLKNNFFGFRNGRR